MEDENMMNLVLLAALSLSQGKQQPVRLFDGKSLAGWEGDTAKTWRVEDGAIVGGSLDAVVPRNEFLATTKTYRDFVLSVSFRIEGDVAKSNAGIQFRTKRIPNHHEVSGFQADIGQDYWGALYDESRRKKVLARPDKETVAKIAMLNAWHTYTIHCEGDRIRLCVDGLPTVDYTETDKSVEKDGIIALQVHGGAKTVARYKDISIQELPGK
jgi:hypothetical protein